MTYAEALARIPTIKPAAKVGNAHATVRTVAGRDITGPSAAKSDAEDRLERLRTAWRLVKSVDCVLFDGEVQAALSMIEALAAKISAAAK